MTPAVRRFVRELATAVVGEREDAYLVEPLLRMWLTTAIADFHRAYGVRQARQRVLDHDLLTASYKHRGTTKTLAKSA